MPFEASDAIAGPMVFGVGMYAMIPPRRPDLVAAVRAGAAGCLTEAIDRGGRPYLYGWHELSEAQRQHIYGAAYDRLTVLKKELDPDGVFQPHQFGISD